jgi:hypothetical protein
MQHSGSRERGHANERTAMLKPARNGVLHKSIAYLRILEHTLPSYTLVQIKRPNLLVSAVDSDETLPNKERYALPQDSTHETVCSKSKLETLPDMER